MHLSILILGSVVVKFFEMGARWEFEKIFVLGGGLILGFICAKLGLSIARKVEDI